MSSKEFLEVAMMKAVNQSIGRAIRHVGDYAAVLLLDERYGAPGNAGVRAKLPAWIAQDMQVLDAFGQLPKQLRDFFKDK